MATTVLYLAQTKQIDCQPFFCCCFHLDVPIWRFPGGSIAIFISHSRASVALYNLFMHSSLANHKQDIFFSI